ncbi:hypothetical protein [Pantoea ananatis]|uniref:hypothetical protein n=1 Tax=Pantoea ananas TaxID=553 RepID=UPI001B308E53|nr:hypothetical protein [Pantoea ananatis]
MSPAKAKEKQQQNYNALAADVANGRAGYQPVEKNPLSKSSDSRFTHSVSFA